MKRADSCLPRTAPDVAGAMLGKERPGEYNNLLEDHCREHHPMVSADSHGCPRSESMITVHSDSYAAVGAAQE
jgi:hypothetical protein